jgi:hypothetical protein
MMYRKLFCTQALIDRRPKIRGEWTFQAIAPSDTVRCKEYLHMSRSTKIIFFVASFVCACALRAQDANPISANMKQSWANVKRLLTRMADKMPEENYRFKPTPEMQDFGQRMAHVISFNMRGCAQVKGDQKAVNLAATASKAEIVAAMKEANDECSTRSPTPKPRKWSSVDEVGRA